ncbi:MAG TPA: hypothetical protein VD788_17780, partial [Candidatus Polarisedimenticolaceae bacterium]|nr:hypothetical protein [Candidatus Polarisedimenticolaceae bacterium]
FEPELFEALGRGYLAVARALLVTAEIDHLVDASIALTFVAGLRFLTDHLAGDRYFRATRPGQNLDRARVQFVLVEQMERAVGPLRAAIARCR